MRERMTRGAYKDILQYEKNIYLGTSRGYLVEIREKDILYKFIRLLRTTEYHLSNQHRIRAAIYKIRLCRMQNKFALHIQPFTCGKGLNIGHVGPIIINDKSRIGENLRVHVGVNIGANGGKAPVIGNNVYIGPCAKIFGDIQIADGCSIGANAVVNKSCETHGAILVGVPAVEKTRKQV